MKNGTYEKMNNGKGKKKPTPQKAFVKFFVITFICCVVGITAGLGAWNMFLDQKPMENSSVAADSPEPVAVTEEKMNILIPASGEFKKDSDFKDSKRVNILLMGDTHTGANEDDNGKPVYGLTDTIMLASFDPETQKMDIISVPRDTYYERGEKYQEYNYGGYLKINSVLETEGIKGAAKAVHNVLEGVPINYYAIMNYEGVEKVVDAIGGVPMDVPMNMHYTDKKQNLYINLKKGKQTLDGAHAIQFLRFRKGYSEGDIGRVKAQQQFVKNAVKEAMGLNLPNVAKTVMDNMNSDLNLRALTYLAGKAVGMGGDDLALHTLPGDDGQRIQGLSFWVPTGSDEVLSMMREVYTGIPQTTEGAIDSEDTTTSSASSED